MMIYICQRYYTKSVYKKGNLHRQFAEWVEENEVDWEQIMEDM